MIIMKENENNLKDKNDGLKDVKSSDRENKEEKEKEKQKRKGEEKEK